MTKTRKSFIINTASAITNGTLRIYMEELLPFMRSLGLSIAEFPYTIADVPSVQVGEFISVGTSPMFDVDIIIRRGYITEKGYAPILDITKDFNEIKARLIDYAIGTNFSEKTLCGDTITFHRGFVKIDNKNGSVILKNEELLEMAARSIQLNLFFG